MAKNIKKIVNMRLRPDQEERINAIVERSAILDTSKFVRIAVDVGAPVILPRARERRVSSFRRT